MLSSLVTFMSLFSIVIGPSELAVEQRVRILVGKPSRICSQLVDVRCALLEIVGDRLPDRLGALAPRVEFGLEVALDLLEFGLQRLKLGLQRRNVGVVLHTFLVIR